MSEANLGLLARESNVIANSYPQLIINQIMDQITPINFVKIALSTEFDEEKDFNEKATALFTDYLVGFPEGEARTKLARSINQALKPMKILSDWAVRWRKKQSYAERKHVAQSIAARKGIAIDSAKARRHSKRFREEDQIEVDENTVEIVHENPCAKKCTCTQPPVLCTPL